MPTPATCYLPHDLALSLEFLARSQLGATGASGPTVRYESTELCTVSADALRRYMPSIDPVTIDDGCALQLATPAWNKLYAHLLLGRAGDIADPTLPLTGNALTELDRVHELIRQGIQQPRTVWHEHAFFAEHAEEWRELLAEHIVIEWAPIHAIRKLSYRNASGQSPEDNNFPERCNDVTQARSLTNDTPFLISGADQRQYMVCAPDQLKALFKSMEHGFIENLALIIRTGMFSVDGASCIGRLAQPSTALNFLMERCKATEWMGLSKFQTAFNQYSECARLHAFNLDRSSPDLSDINTMRMNCINEFLARWPANFLEQNPEYRPLYKGWMVRGELNAVVHYSSTIYPNVTLNEKCEVLAGAVVQSGATIGARVVIPVNMIVTAGADIKCLDLETTLYQGSRIGGSLTVGKRVKFEGPIELQGKVRIFPDLITPSRVGFAANSEVQICRIKSKVPKRTVLGGKYKNRRKR
ncbi:MAG: hypothetical protein JWQ23_4161 [Herminiimonas sp.]|nr:hypothetical protein [Herminiimonas sp.]